MTPKNESLLECRDRLNQKSASCLKSVLPLRSEIFIFAFRLNPLVIPLKMECLNSHSLSLKYEYVCVCVCVCVSHSVVSDSLRPHEL